MGITTRVAVLGGGHGVAAVLAALRDAPVELTAIITTADDGGSSGDLRRHFGGPAVGDLRRSLVALSDGTNLLATVMSQPLETDYGRHPVGNLLIQSLMDSLGDLESIDSVARRVARYLRPRSAGKRRAGQTARGHRWPAHRRESGLPWCADPGCSPPSLYTQHARDKRTRPQIVSALARTRARVLLALQSRPWITGETAGMNAEDNLTALRAHGVRVDGVIRPRRQAALRGGRPWRETGSPGSHTRSRPVAVPFTTRACSVRHSSHC